MIRIGRRGIGGAVTLIAACEDDLIIVVRVARFALQCLVQSRQRKLRGAMVERCVLPRGGGMAHGTVLRETAGLVARIRRRREIRTVTINTIRGERRKLVVRVAILTLDGAMGAREREFGVVVRER